MVPFFRKSLDEAIEEILDQGLQNALTPHCVEDFFFFFLVINRIREQNLNGCRSPVALGGTNWIKFVDVQEVVRVDNMKCPNGTRS